MSTPPEDTPKAPWRPLDERQRRVLGVLIEKAKTTPAGYPMTSSGCRSLSLPRSKVRMVTGRPPMPLTTFL